MPLDDNKKLTGKYYRETVYQIIRKKNEEIIEAGEVKVNIYKLAANRQIK